MYKGINYLTLSPEKRNRQFWIPSSAYLSFSPQKLSPRTLCCLYRGTVSCLQPATEPPRDIDCLPLGRTVLFRRPLRILGALQLEPTREGVSVVLALKFGQPAAVPETYRATDPSPRSSFSTTYAPLETPIPITNVPPLSLHHSTSNSTRKEGSGGNSGFRTT